MAENSKIQWTDSSWNPIRFRNHETGGVGHFCEKVSPGCSKCYSEKMQRRFKNNIRFNAADADKGELFLDLDVLRKPLGWKKPRMVFVCSMTDLFLDRVPFEWIAAIYGVMALSPRHTFQVLTKRPERAKLIYDYASKFHYPVAWCVGKTCDEFREPMVNMDKADYHDWPLSNVWLGISAEDQQRADERLSLLECPAAVRFISYEPALSRVDWAPFLCPACGGDGEFVGDYGEVLVKCDHDYTRIDWLIAGCEQLQPGHRPGRGADEYEENVRHTIAQCQTTGVPVFHKQMPINGRVSGDPSEWPEDLRIRQFPTPRKETA